MWKYCINSASTGLSGGRISEGLLLGVSVKGGSTVVALPILNPD